MVNISESLKTLSINTYYGASETADAGDLTGTIIVISATAILKRECDQKQDI